LQPASEARSFFDFVLSGSSFTTGFGMSRQIQTHVAIMVPAPTDSRGSVIYVPSSHSPGIS
jgi:hypothetical protein